MKYVIIILIFLYNFDAFSQNKAVIDSIYSCQIINDDFKKIIDQFFVYEDSVWGYNQYNKVFPITLETVNEYEIENLDSITGVNHLFCLLSGYKKTTFKFFYSSDRENPTIYYVTNYKNRKIVFLLDRNAIPFIECIVKPDNKVAVKMFPIEMNKPRRRYAKERRSYLKFSFNENCEFSSKLYWKNYKNVPLELRIY